MKVLNALLTLLLLVSTVGTVFSYMNNQTLIKRIDLMSCKIDLVNARIDVLSGKPARRVDCLNTLFPIKPVKHT